MTDQTEVPPVPFRELFAQTWELLTHQDRVRSGVVLAFIIVGTALEILGLGLIIPVVTLLSQPSSSGIPPALKTLHTALGSPSPQLFMIWSLAGLMAAFFIKNGFLFFSIFRQTKFLSDLQAKLAGELMAGYLKRPYTFHLHHSSPELMQKINGEIPVFIQSVLGPLFWVASESLVVLGLLFLALWVNPLGALIVVGGLGVTLWGYYHMFKRRVEFWGRQTQEHAKGMYQEMQHGLGGIKEVKIFGREGFFSTAFTRHAEGHAQGLCRHNFLSQSSRQVIELLVITVLLGAIMLLVGRGGAMQEILPMLAFFGAAAFRLMPSAQRLISSAHSIRHGARSLPLLLPDLRQARASGESQPEQTEPTAFLEELALTRVSFQYPGGHEAVLRDVDLIIPRGAMVGFQGESGSGKTTLVDLILGLLEPGQGEITVDGKSIHANLPRWQKNIGYVPQKIFLIDDTLRRNVAFGLEEKNINDDRVIEVLRQAQLAEFVKTRPEGVHAKVGERGIRLSGGEQQRIGIARALYHNPGILVLDEATASLDLATEAEFMKIIQALKNKKTILLISHRLSAMEGCDKTYKLESAQLQPMGTQPVNS